MTAPQVFDPLAATYDDTFTDTAIGRYLRGQVQDRLARHFGADDRVLELGCGTGEDALFLASRGVRVTATDASTAMLAITRAKAANNPLVTVEHLDLRELPVTSRQLPALHADEPFASTEDNLNLARSTRHLEHLFAGAFSNFGPLNCLDDWRPLAAWLAGRVKPGGVVAFGVMSPLCLWEPLWHGLHGDFKTATRRWRKQTEFRLLPPPPFPYYMESSDGHSILIHYPTIRRLTRDFVPWFKRVHVQGLGLFLPPSDVYGAIEKRPRLLKALLALEERFSPLGKLALFADHYWVEFERQAET